MKKIIILSVILFSISCTSKSQEVNNSKVKQETIEKKQIVANKETNRLTVVDDLYTLNIYIETSTSNVHYLVMDMELKDSSYFVSPLAKAGFKGMFIYDLGSYKDISFFGEVLETPSAFKHIKLSPLDTTVEDGLVYENTVYKQALTMHSDLDFEVIGSVQFTIEPRCTYETIPFKITLEFGVFKISKAKC